MSMFRGILSVKDGRASLDAEGIVVTLDGKAGDFEPYHQQKVLVTGKQQGAVITGASIAGLAEIAAEKEDTATGFREVIKAIGSGLQELKKPGVIGVRPGFSTLGDINAPDRVIVVLTDPQVEVTGLPQQIGGIRVEVRKANPLEMVEGIAPLSAWDEQESTAEASAIPPNIHYVIPPASLVSLTDMEVSNITCHVGPDSGWANLKPFLEGTKKSLTVAMYEFYAQHILDTVTALGEDSTATLDLILQVDRNDANCKATLAQSWGSRLSFTAASVRGGKRLFNNSYHTKVAVRDSKAVWLSSGNWSPNSQPLIRPGTENALYKNGNREWHVIINDRQVAAMYEKFIKYDIAQATALAQPEAASDMPDLLVPESFFVAPEAAVIQDHPFDAATFGQDEPVKIKPLMSPDNYAQGVLDLINSAKKSLYLQFSYINQPSSGIFDQIISSVGAKMKAGLDVKVIAGSNQKPESSDLLIGKRKWKRSMFRVQKTKLHNKGILVDGKIVLIGSNNWSSDGTQYNRDTSLIFYSRPIAQYYTEVFMFDWTYLTRPVGSAPAITPVLGPETGPTPTGMVRIPWQTWFNE